ncbi:Polyisoprenoid-binding protein YceI [Catalinimonas alkaloidigena]|uniref:Polyisoprenoid-binding protein YceI n=1 Tax=Catalinimonas alkaloidigena TaxID=1075417 RepID=A0A1G9LL77_9BACT|nr:YceI family protein [Catalinimonas alkaloidigena]SDL62255.1 Polyisoprenoid-binding protein YceI [Catalinimonas alkaloidigena]
MKKVSSFFFAAALMVAATVQASNGPQATTQTVDTDKSSLEWVGKKVTGQHNGTIDLKSGSLQVNGNKVTGGSFVIDMSSIVVKDIQDAEMNGKLTGHLNSEDFFSVEKHPTATFVITNVKALKGNQAEITGDLTIKGITHAVTFPATVSVSKQGTKATAEFDIDRTKWDIRYGSGSFFEGLGDKVIYDDFTIRLNLVTNPEA